MSGTNRKAIMVWWVASQVQGVTDLLGKAFQSRKVCVVTEMIVYNLLECLYWSMVKVVEYDHVSKWEWVYAPWRWIYAV